MASIKSDIMRVTIPPIKCQGIKSKLVPFIKRTVDWSFEGRWIEPFPEHSHEEPTQRVEQLLLLEKLAEYQKSERLVS